MSRSEHVIAHKRGRQPPGEGDAPGRVKAPAGVIWMVTATTVPSAPRVPVTVTVSLLARSAVDPVTCFWIVVEGANVMVTLQPVLVTVIEVAVRFVTVPRASAVEPAAGVGPGVGHAAALAPPPAGNP